MSSLPVNDHCLVSSIFCKQYIFCIGCVWNSVANRGWAVLVYTFSAFLTALPCSLFLLWVILSPLLVHLCYPFWLVVKRYTWCLAFAATLRQLHELSIQKEELSENLNSQVVCELMRYTQELKTERKSVRTHTYARTGAHTHTHTIKFYVNIWFENCKNCYIVINKLFMFLFYSIFKMVVVPNSTLRILGNNWKLWVTLQHRSPCSFLFYSKFQFGLCIQTNIITIYTVVNLYYSSSCSLQCRFTWVLREFERKENLTLTLRFFTIIM